MKIPPNPNLWITLKPHLLIYTNVHLCKYLHIWLLETKRKVSAMETKKQTAQDTAEPIKRLSLDLPESMHIRFKTACSATGRKMGTEVQDLIEKRITSLENEAGIVRK